MVRTPGRSDATRRVPGRREVWVPAARVVEVLAEVPGACGAEGADVLGDAAAQVTAHVDARTVRVTEHWRRPPGGALRSLGVAPIAVDGWRLYLAALPRDYRLGLAAEDVAPLFASLGLAASNLPRALLVARSGRTRADAWRDGLGWFYGSAALDHALPETREGEAQFDRGLAAIERLFLRANDRAHTLVAGLRSAEAETALFLPRDPYRARPALSA